MTTPNYKGQNQPAATSGSWLTSLFGGGTPAYASKPAIAAQTASAQTASTQTASAQTATAQSTPAQPATAQPGTVSGPFFAFAAPAYRLAPASEESGCDETALAIVIPQQSSDPQS